jgi:hypothetical protein
MFPPPALLILADIADGRIWHPGLSVSHFFVVESSLSHNSLIHTY